jgi:hypothetical protein
MLVDFPDEFCLESDDPYVTLYFLADARRRALVQINFNDSNVLVFGSPVVGLALDEALLNLGVKSFDDTLWSMVDCDSEYTGGVPIRDELRPTSAELDQLLESGTLWIKSMGLGLYLYDGQVEALVVRRLSDVPTVGCGPLTKEAVFQAVELQDEGSSREQVKRKADPAWLRKWLARLLPMPGLVLMLAPAVMLVNRFRAWQHATTVTGTVVGTIPEGPFPDYVVVEYPYPDLSPGQIRIRVTQVAARQLGDEVRICYLPSPAAAVTAGEASSQFLDGYLPYLALAGAIMAIPVAGMAVSRTHENQLRAPWGWYSKRWGRPPLA